MWSQWARASRYTACSTIVLVAQLHPPCITVSVAHRSTNALLLQQPQISVPVAQSSGTTTSDYSACSTYASRQRACSTISQHNCLTLLYVKLLLHIL